MSDLISKFRETNKRLNRLFFGSDANAYSHYLTLLEQSIQLARVVVDVGASSLALEDYLPNVGQPNALFVAVDIDASALKRNRSPARVAADAEALPFGDETVDLLAVSCAFEHMGNPAPIFSEFYRVLKSDGRLVFVTPNRRCYISIIARMTGLGFHRWVRMLQSGKSFEDANVWETLYKVNTPAELRRYGKSFGDLSLKTYMGAPTYTTFSPPAAHFAFILHHKLVQMVSWLRELLGEIIVGCMTKSLTPSDASAAQALPESRHEPVRAQ